jgi:hypothetical protein
MDFDFRPPLCYGLKGLALTEAGSRKKKRNCNTHDLRAAVAKCAAVAATDAFQVAAHARDTNISFAHMCRKGCGGRQEVLVHRKTPIVRSLTAMGQKKSRAKMRSD